MNHKTITKTIASVCILVLIFSVYLVLSSAAINEKQMIYGDGHNLYVSHRLAQGLTLYEDIEVLYGPTFYLIGSNLMILGLTYPGLKIFMLIISITSGILIFLITKKSFNNEGVSLLATTFYMFAPLHYGMSPVFHPDSIAILFCLISLYLLLQKNNLFLVLSAVFASAAVFTKILAFPLIFAAMVYFLINKKKEGLFFVIPFLIIIILLLLYVNIYDNANDNTRVILDQLLNETDYPDAIIRDVVWIEGLLIILGIVGILAYGMKIRTNSVLLVVTFSTPVAFGVILAPGVGAHEFNWMEPFLAIFASYAIFRIKNIKKLSRPQFGKIIGASLVILILIQSTIFIWPDRERIADWDGEGRFKLLNDLTNEHTNLIQQHTVPGDIVVASSMAAYKTNRVLPLDNAFPDLLEFKHEYGYETAQIEIAKLKTMVENKEIKILINYGKSEYLNKILFFPYYLDSFNKTITENYNKFGENGFDYYLPKQ